MELPPERSRALHNFTLPTLRWGNQRHLRCMKINEDSQQPNSNSTAPGSQTKRTHHQRDRSSLPKSPPATSNDDDDGIEAVREKVMSDLRDAADRMKISMLEDKDKKQQQHKQNHHNQNQKKQNQLPAAVPAAGANAYSNASEPNSNSNNSNSNSNSASAAAAAAAAARPCNLRTRRAACKEPPPPPPPPPPAPVVESSPRRANGGNNKPPESPAVTLKSTRLRGLAAAANNARQSLERGGGEGSSQGAKFSLSLTREEIEADFLAMTGKKPPRRPKKRTRIVQKQVDACYPGLWLPPEVTPDRYKMPDLPDSGKA